MDVCALLCSEMKLWVVGPLTNRPNSLSFVPVGAAEGVPCAVGAASVHR